VADAAISAPGESTGLVPTSLASADWRARLTGFTRQPAVRRALPAIIGLGAVSVLASVYLAMAQGPQRTLYSTLSDGERAQVVEALQTGGITYAIDNATGMITVAEDDYHRARMLVASDAGLAAPAGASEMLDAIPLGSSRTLEGERLKMARERELMLTIKEIDGIEAVRVHLATPERSAFVREASAPSASVMLRLAGGRSLGQSQVEAIVNLVSGSVPGMSAENVRVVDQNGRLLTSERDTTLDGLTLQREFEDKLHDQLSALLTPLLGEGNFSTQVAVELDQSEVTSAREQYEPEGIVRSESESTAVSSSGAAAGGIPGVTANTPPAEAQLINGAPDPTAQAQAGAGPVSNESATQRRFEIDREVAVTAKRPGGLVKLSVAVAISQKALKAASPLTQQRLQDLVRAAVGADDARGDQVQVVVSKFDPTEIEPLAFYEEPWFALALRTAAALIAVLLVLLLGVRPLIKRMFGAGEKSADGEDDEPQEEREPGAPDSDDGHDHATNGQRQLPRQVELARRLAATQPDRAVEALQRMLAPPSDPATGGEDRT
jgi:flagellar M-ring protein FliF